MASVQVVKILNVSSGAESGFLAVKDKDNFYGFNIQSGLLRAQKNVAGQISYLALGTYNIQTQKYLRLRHNQSTNIIFWEISADGLNWSSLYQETPAFVLNTIHFELVAGTYKSETSPGTSIFDNFNILNQGGGGIQYTQTKHGAF